ncbi:hypothetical protein [Bacillus cereus]|uniref:hypothetical protein n=1 Tax=Bacillus cereus TaxID=1396 RepID=UPI000BFA72D0|nr:hypothetical protein [Bacillus cereus]PFV40276.1 hypothetical protein COL00_26050 [Bacillus cereus]PGQ11909.1 hypothetical protein COA09_17445 [Bacillus cereus]PGS50551.1 hypothetical protein COC67_26565 [Bacillus cereus]PGV05769.1 hypothetical protein COD77_17225 [Bacillus cereus]
MGQNIEKDIDNIKLDKETSKEVKEILKQLDVRWLALDLDITPDWYFIERSTEKISLFGYESEYHKQTKESVRTIVNAINKLNIKEREIIIRRFLRREERYDYEVANKMGLSLRTYERYKSLAIRGHYTCPST